MLNLLLTWIVIGGFIGFSANFLEFFTTRQKLIASVILGVAGAASGGAFGVFMEMVEPSTVRLSPMLYSVMGASFLSLLPVRGRIF